MNKAKMFNKKAASAKSKPDDVLAALKIKKGQVIADIGAGGGYFTLRFAEVVGSRGRVYAIDKNTKFLKYIEQQAIALKLNNVTIIQSETADLDLKPGSIDLIFMRNVTHHIKNRTEYFSKLKKYLTLSGRIAIIDYKYDKNLSFHSVFGHYVDKDKLIAELAEAGFEVSEDFDFLPSQHFIIFHSARRT